MLLKNAAARLITVNHREEDGTVISYDILPGDNPAVEVPKTHAQSDFVKANIANGSLIVLAADTEDDADELDDLREQAKALGIKVDKRWGEDRLLEEIAAKQAE